MSKITVTFTRDTTSYTLTNVRSVEWVNEYATNQLVNQTTEIGQQYSTYTVKGFVIVYGDPSDNVTAQQAMETALRGVGVGDLTYTGSDILGDTRFVSLEFDEYRGNPVAQYTAIFVTEVANIHAHIVKIGTLTLNPANGFDPPQTTDKISAQGPDEQINNLKTREFNIQGSLVGTSIDEVNTVKDNLITEVADKATVVITLSIDNGGLSIAVRPQSLEFSAPAQRERDVARRFTFVATAHDDYSKEPYTLGESVLTFGTIQIDIVSSLDNNIITEKDGTIRRVISETFTVNGKKYFANWSAYNVFAQSFTPFPAGTAYNITAGSFTQNDLELINIDIGEFKRDGNYPVSNDKRYSASITLSYEWKKDISEINELTTVTRLGVSWYKISNTSHQFAIDQYGNVNQRSVSLSGQIFETHLNTLKSKLGTLVDLGDTNIPGEGTDTYYVSSININKVDTLLPVSGVASKIYDISVTAMQLDTASQVIQFISNTFQTSFASTAAYKTLLFDNITSQSRSVSSTYESNTFRVSSISTTLSGEVWDVESVTTPGTPNTPDKVIRILKELDATQTSALSTRVGAAYDVGNFLPNNYSFFVNNFSIGKWEPFIKQKAPNKDVRMWKQTVSISATTVFTLSDSTGNQPDRVDTSSSTIQDETIKYSVMQVLGKGTVFKNTGINPSIAQVVVQSQFKNQQLLEVANPQKSTLPVGFDLNPPNDWPFGALAANYESTKDSFEIRGDSARWVRGYTAKKAKADV